MSRTKRLLLAAAVAVGLIGTTAAAQSPTNLELSNSDRESQEGATLRESSVCSTGNSILHPNDRLATQLSVSTRIFRLHSRKHC